MEMFPAKSLLEVERFMVEQPQVECPVFHKFSPGMYIRELHMAAGTIALGHYHRFPHLCFFIKGRMIFHNEDGTHTEMAAPQVFTAPAGRKLAYVVEDTIFTNVFVTDETDVDKLEEMLLDKSVALPLNVPVIEEAVCQP